LHKREKWASEPKIERERGRKEKKKKTKKERVVRLSVRKKGLQEMGGEKRYERRHPRGST